MLTDVKANEGSRQQLLDEIRKRAEEAELARIEAEELKLALESPRMSPAPPDALASATDELHTSEVTDLRDELAQALVNNDLDRASSLYSELSALLPDDPVVDQFGAEIARLKDSLNRESRKPAHTADEGLQNIELLNAANAAYQREQYDDAMQKVAALLKRDPENVEALDLQRNIEKAKDLAERLKAEEERLQAEQQQEPESISIVPQKPSQAFGTTSGAKPTEPTPSPSSLPDSERDDAPPASPSVLRQAAAFLSSHKWGIVVAGVLVFLGVQVASVVYHHLRTTVLRDRASVLIVPIVGTDGGNGSNDLVYGLADDLAAQLSQFPGLDVFAPTASMQHNRSDLDATRLAQELRAEFLLTLSLVSNPDSVVIRMSVRRTTEGDAATEKTYVTQRGKLALMRNEAVAMLVRTMDVQRDEHTVPSVGYTPRDAAYETYLVARSLLHRPMPGAVDSALQMLRSATQQDSLFPEAQILLGRARVLLYEASRDTSPSLLQQAQANLQRGIGLGAKGSGLYTLWGMINYYTAQYHEAIERLKEAVEMAPSDAEAQRRLALAFVRVGRTEQALQAAHRAVQFDPRNPLSHSLLGRISLLLRDKQTALRELQAEAALMPDRSPNDTYVAALVANDRREQALDLVKQQLATNADTIAALYNLGRMYQLAGKSKRLWDEALGQAKGAVQRQLRTRPDDPRLFSYLALIETRMGNFKEGMAACSRALALASHDYETLYSAARVVALQRGLSPEVYTHLAKAIYRRFSLEQILDLDLLALQDDPDFVRKITQ